MSNLKFSLLIDLDEVSALVIDSGSCTTRAGFAGEDSPKTVFSTSYGYRDAEDVEMTDKPEADGEDEDSRSPNGGSDNKSGSPKKQTQYFIGDNSIHIPRNDVEIRNPMNDGIVSDWDATEQLWDHIFKKTLQVDCANHPLLLTEQIWNTKKNREAAMELALETFDFPAFYIVKSPVASLFASGKGSGLVVDIGHDVTSVTPIIDGLPLYKPSRRSRFAGAYLSRQVRHLIEDKQSLPLNPRYLISKRQIVPPGSSAEFVTRQYPGINVTPSFHTQEVNRVLDEFKESMAQVSDTPFSLDMKDSITPRLFEFPDGSSKEYGVERFQVAESLFKPKDNALPLQPLEDEPVAEPEAPEIIADGKATEAESNDPTPAYMYADSRPVPQFSNTLGLSDLIVDSINACDIDIRANLANNIVITGGSSVVQGLTDRVNSDLSQALAGIKIRIYAPGNTIERNYSPWIGGSILASLGTFHQLWISKKEYEEVGASKLLERRFR